MSQRMIRRTCVLLALTLTLALAGPTRADAAQRMGPASLWRWLENFWQEGLVNLVKPERPALPDGTKPPSPTKEGTCTDPNGCPKQPVTRPGGSGG